MSHASKRQVAVLFGGRSAEHEISCISGRYLMDALDRDRNDAIAVGVTRDGDWRVLDRPCALPSEAGVLPVVTADAGRGARLISHDGRGRLMVDDGSTFDIDVVFNIIHGPMGEDGSIQGLLQVSGIPYVGAAVLGSAIGMDKAVQKTIFRDEGIPVVPWVTVREPEWRDDPEQVAASASQLGYPVFVKPVNLGSSVGIGKAHGPAELEAIMDDAFRYSRKVIVEKGIENAREIECAVLGNDDPVASITGEIVPTGGHEFYDYSAKYLDEAGSKLEIPAVLPQDMSERIQSLAVAAFRAIDCWGMSRVDFFVSGENVWLNEINTLPGFTSISMYPKLWAASGVDYPSLIERLLDLALERHHAESLKRTLPD